MRATDSLRGRLIVAATAWIAFGMVAAWLVLSAVFARHVTEQFHEELYVHLEELQRLALLDGERAALRHNLSDPRYDVAQSGYYWEIQKDGKVLARSSSMQGAPLRTPPDQRSDVGVHTHTIAGPTGTLVVAERLEWKNPAENPVQFIIGTDKRHLDHVLGSFNTTLSWSLLGLGLSMVLAAGLLILFAMRPFEALRDGLSSVRSGSTKSLAGRFPSEVQSLVDELNALIASTADLIQRARTQAGNIAHGLKTPLAILTDEAHRIADQGLPTSAATILDQCRKLQTHIDYQTTRARVVATRLSLGASASVRQAISEIVSAMTCLHRGRSLTYVNEVPAALAVACDRQDLHEILANLVDNASKHAKSQVRVRAGLTSDQKTVEVKVEDDGPGLPPEAYDVVFNIGERWDTQETGSGLGLAIARDLAQLYDGDIRLYSSDLGGLEAVVTLPATKAPGS